jgi:hypothetical protein
LEPQHCLGCGRQNRDSVVKNPGVDHGDTETIVHLLRMRLLIPKAIAAASLVAFALSLTQRGYHCFGVAPSDAPSGWELLKIGWFVIPDGMLSWLGNPFLFGAWIYFARGRYGVSAILSAAAVLTMLEFLLHDSASPKAAAHSSSLIVERGIAYWAWLASSAVMLIASSTARALTMDWPDRSELR